MACGVPPMSGASMVFVYPHDFGCRNACARSAPLANPLTRSGVSRTIIRPQTLAVGRPPFRYVRALRLRVPGAALPGGRNVLRPSRHGSCRARNRVVKTGLRPRRPQTPGPAAPVPPRLHSRTPLHSRRPTASDCSSVRLLMPSTNQCQRCETAALDSAPAEPGAHRGPPTRPAITNWAHRSRTRCGPPHAPEGFDARGDNAPRPTKECGSFASSLTAPNGLRATTGCTSVSPGTRSARPGEGDGGRHATAFPESRPTSCPAVHVPRPGFFWHSGCAGSACNRTLWPMGARSAPQSKHSIGAAPSLRRASGMWS